MFATFISFVAFAVLIQSSLQGQVPLDTPALSEISELLTEQARRLSNNGGETSELVYSRRLLAVSPVRGAFLKDKK